MPDDLCEACGERNAPDTDFCLACGMYLGWGERLRLQQRKAGSSTVTSAPQTARDAAADAGADDDADATRPQMAASVRSSEAPARPVRRFAPPPEEPSPPEPEPQMTAAAPTQPPCTRCGRANTLDRRFCAKCGLALGGDPRLAYAAVQTRPHQRLPWWQRIFRRRKSTTVRAAEKSYRRTVPLRYRAFRIVTFLVVVCLLGGGFAVAGRNPVSWAKQRWADMRDTAVAVTAVEAVADPLGCELSPDESGARMAVDTDDATAWVRNWSPDPLPGGECDVTMGGDLLLTWEEPREVVGLRILAGLPEGDSRTGAQWRPQQLELRFSDGSDQLVVLAETPAVQEIEIEPTSTDALRIEIMSAFSPPDGETVNRISISEVTVLARPAS